MEDVLLLVVSSKSHTLENDLLSHISKEYNNDIILFLDGISVSFQSTPTNYRIAHNSNELLHYVHEAYNSGKQKALLISFDDLVNKFNRNHLKDSLFKMRHTSCSIMCIDSKRIKYNQQSLAIHKLWQYIFNNIFKNCRVYPDIVEFIYMDLSYIIDLYPVLITQINLDLLFKISLNLIKSKNLKLKILNSITTINDFSLRDFSISELAERLAYIYSIMQNEKVEDLWIKSFIDNIKYFNQTSLKNLLEKFSHEILDNKNTKYISNSKITIYELLALCCKSKFEEKIEEIPKIEEHEYSIYDCWYDDSSNNAICSHLKRDEKCPTHYPISLSNKGIQIHPTIIDVSDKIKQHSNIFKNLNTVFDPVKYNYTGVLPVSIGIIEDKKTFSQFPLRAQPQNVPIKFPFSHYKIPEEVSQFTEIVQKVANFWHSVNPDYSDYYYCYLSVAQSCVPPGCYQRRGHIHSDGFQSYWLKYPIFSDFVFIASDIAQTEFFTDGFDTSRLDPSRDNYFQYFTKNIADKKSKKCRNAYEIVAMDAYTLHKSICNNTKSYIPRTFVRLMYSVIRWDSISNSVNPMFSYYWPRYKRSLLNNLK